MEFIVFRTPKKQIKQVFLDDRPLRRYNEAYLLEQNLLPQEANVNDLPLGVPFYLCEQIEEEEVTLRSPEVTLERVGDNTVRVQFFDVNRRQDWEEQFGLRFTKEVKREVLRKWKGVQIDEAEDWQDDGDAIALYYAKEFTDENLPQLLHDVYQFDEEIEKITRERQIQIVMPPFHYEHSLPYLKKKRIGKPSRAKQVDLM